MNIPDALKKAGIPATLISNYATAIALAFGEFNITSDKQQAMFLANVLHETGGLKFLRELWGPTPQQSRYEMSQSLGNTARGDGFKFRGRGMIQTTGRANYARAGARLKLDLLNKPELLEQPLQAARSACLFWVDNKIGTLADAGDFDGVCDKINKGHKTSAIGDSNGYAERLAYYRKITS